VPGPEEIAMKQDSSAGHAQKTRVVLAIVIGGALAGTFDATSAFITFGSRMPQGIAAGLLGPRAAFQGGAATWILGLLLHFLIAFTAAAVFCLASLKLTFLRRNFIVSGIYYGMTVFLFMSLVVVPLSAIHASGPFTASGLLKGIGFQIFLIGLPISLSAWKLVRVPGE
jgi:hypothetical protein